MPCLAFAYNPVVGPIIQVAIFPFNFTPPNPAPGQAPFQVTLYNALIDTGASCTCISAKVCTDLKLTPIGKQTVGGVHGKSAANQYQFQVAVPFGQGQVNPSGTSNVSFFIRSTVGVEVVPSASFDILLGRDVLCMGSLTLGYDGHGMLCL